MDAKTIVWLFVTIVGGNGDPNSPSAIITVTGKFKSAESCQQLRDVMKGDEWVVKTQCVPVLKGSRADLLHQVETFP